MIDQREAFKTLVAGTRATIDATAERPALRGELLRELLSPRERRRADNRDRYNRSSKQHSEREFRCECARPDCRTRLPLEVDRHRRWSDRFIVGLAHADTDTVVGVADRFLVVKANGMRAVPPAVAGRNGSALVRRQ